MTIKPHEPPVIGRWIEMALRGSKTRRFIVANDTTFGYMAILQFTDLGTACGKHANTIHEAVTALDNELERNRDCWCYGHPNFQPPEHTKNNTTPKFG